ncbi:RNA degradosome polyphosphate kinase [Pseudoblastomonas halimionae]|uniref:RNA degradosome polyphosphate kinase n=1 Tax=Alteriqipengyuania halimionae TaxID=1926630 RepID=UPI002D7ED3B6|nr:RNA degradosome polyphosphate kinase [Alteriqipengyuania halimionae]
MTPLHPAAPSSDEDGSTFEDEHFFNRELSWLTFNRRVLAEARNRDFPLLERLRFLSISGSNLDEFIMVRVAGLMGQAKRGIDELSLDGMTPGQQLDKINDELERIEREQDAVWDELRAELTEAGIEVIDGDDVDKTTAKWLERYFTDDILPVLTPQAVDPAHPFPFVANLGLVLLFNLKRKGDSVPLIEMVLLPPNLPRFIRIPGDHAQYISLENMIRRHAHILFPGFKLRGDGLFRVIRDSDIEVEEESEDLVRYFRSAIQRRRRGDVVHLEIEDGCDNEAESLLHEQLYLAQATVDQKGGLIGYAALSEIVDEDRPDLKFEPYSPRYPERIAEHDGDAFSAIREKDIVIHHPYESFEVVVDFLWQAARDPDVVAIKQTLYRAGTQSPVIAALIAAAEAGKSVTAVVELKARFDEEQNIHWASELERSGVQVIYGFVDWKTHAKVSMVVRREGEGFRTYCHFGTGNYHPTNAKVYTDLSYFTAEPAMGRDAARLFNFVTGYVEPEDLERLSISPTGLRRTVYDLIDAEIANAEEGKPAAIWGKMNALADRKMIEKLYQASQAGVRISLVVRGICCLRPEVPGLSDNITVKSVIGRFLEHSRIYAFANGEMMPGKKSLVYLSSADWMSRNLDRRVETLVPLTTKTVHNQVLYQVMLANLLDTERSWRLLPDGTYERMHSEANSFNLHSYFMENPSLSGRGGALRKNEDVPRLSLRRESTS